MYIINKTFLLFVNTYLLIVICFISINFISLYFLFFKNNQKFIITFLINVEFRKFTYVVKISFLVFQKILVRYLLKNYQKKKIIYKRNLFDIR